MTKQPNTSAHVCADCAILMYDYLEERTDSDGKKYMATINVYRCAGCSATWEEES